MLIAWRDQQPKHGQHVHQVQGGCPGEDELNMFVKANAVVDLFLVFGIVISCQKVRNQMTLRTERRLIFYYYFGVTD
jgi:hypothetical protein